ncbi:hypothetical protein NCS52_01032300 [Fusarium sp. LHS14.1]|nr:hypothetical protein NCS52_01032300 [Fusarium sp. LHS14.1]
MMSAKRAERTITGSAPDNWDIRVQQETGWTGGTKRYEDQKWRITNAFDQKLATSATMFWFSFPIKC